MGKKNLLIGIFIVIISIFVSCGTVESPTSNIEERSLVGKWEYIEKVSGYIHIYEFLENMDFKAIQTYDRVVNETFIGQYSTLDDELTIILKGRIEDTGDIVLWSRYMVVWPYRYKFNEDNLVLINVEKKEFEFVEIE